MKDDASWDEYAESWDDDEAAHRYADQAFESLIARVLPHLTAGESRVLDFGCGTGLLTTKLSGRFAEVVALDASPKMVQVLDTKLQNESIANITTVVGDIEDADFSHPALANGSFDLIVAWSVCAFLTNVQRSLRSLAALLRSGGTFVQWDWLAKDDDDFGFTPEQIEVLYVSAGLPVVDVAPAFALEGKSEKPLEVLMGIARRDSSSLE